MSKIHSDDVSLARAAADSRVVALRRGLVARSRVIRNAMTAGAVVGAGAALSYALFERLFG